MDMSIQGYKNHHKPVTQFNTNYHSGLEINK